MEAVTEAVVEEKEEMGRIYKYLGRKMDRSYANGGMCPEDGGRWQNDLTIFTA